MGLYVPRPPSHMKWGSRGLNWWAGKGQTPLESLFGGDREAKAGAGASYTCNVTPTHPSLTVKLNSLKESSSYT